MEGNLFTKIRKGLKVVCILYFYWNGFNHGVTYQLCLRKTTLTAAWRVTCSKAKGDVGDPMRRPCREEQWFPKHVHVPILGTCEFVNYMEKKN